MQRRRRSWLANTIILLLGVFVLAPIQSEACGPGRAGGRRRMLRKYSPLVWRQYIPNVSEDTQGASGLPEGTIRRTDRRFKELVQNWNPDIVFRDDEKTGADRMMSQRLKERLSVLAISVMNQWPNVKLRVIEGWDEDHVHGPKSLHYEGRAVDITTSDKDQSKYGMLARLAIEAGFDWTHYESRSHVHCSVKSERADAVRNNGCFDAESLVETPYGQMEMSQLQKNDLVLTMEPQTGQLQFSPIIMWLDRDQVEQDLFVELRTKSGRSIRLTSSHLIYVADEEPMEDGANQQQNSHNNSNRVVDLTTSDVSPQTEASIQPPTTGHEQANAHKSNQDEQNYNKYYYDIRSDSSKVAKLKYSDKLAKSKQTRSGAVSEKCDDSGDVPSASYGDRQESRPRGRLTTTLDAVYTTYARNVVVGQYLLIDSATSSETGEPQQRSPQATDIRFAPHIYSLLSQMSRANNRQETRLKSTEYTNQILIDSTQQTLSHMKHEGDGDIQEPGEEYIEGQTLADSATTKITEGKAELDQVLEIHYVSSHGIYAPLTREGNIVVNSVVASCYAVISEHEMAHMSFAPVRWLSYLNEWLFGLRPETSQSSRTVRAIEKASSKQPLRVPYDQYSNPTTIHPGDNQKMLRFGANQSQRLDETSDDQRQIHWYPRMLYAIARFMLPNRYLY